MKQYDISHEICMSVKTVDSNEPLVDLSKYSKNIIIEIEDISRKSQGLRPGVCFVRKSVAEKLVNVQGHLPKGLHLKIIDTYRPLSAQKKWWRLIFKEIKTKNPSMPDKEAEIETDKWVANPKKVIPLHSTGGTLDLTIAGKSGQALDLGSPVNSTTKESVTNAKISKIGRRNRNLLTSAMSKAGFANYKAEYWHWSYGDWGWAYANKKKKAIYGAIY